MYTLRYFCASLLLLLSAASSLYPFTYRYKELRGIVEDSVGAGELPPDLPSDHDLIAAGAAAVADQGPNAAEHTTLKGKAI